MGGQYLLLRDGVYHFRRRVPTDVADRDPRGSVRMSLKTRDRGEALVRAARVNAELEACWSALCAAPHHDAGDGLAAIERFEQAVRLARTVGVAYRPAAELLAGHVDEVVRRLDLIEARHATAPKPVTDAVLGTVATPALRLSEMFAAYERYSRDLMSGKSADQIRKWRSPRLRAIDNLIALIGDKALADITRNDALDFREWWLDRVVEEGYDPGSANKDLGNLGTMFRRLDLALRLGLASPFQDLRVAGERHNPRTPYEAEFVRARILPDRELVTLNDEARAIVLLVATTGARPSEIAALTPARIRLDHAIPHVEIAPESRQLKSRHSARRIPLVGLALATLRRFEEGFPRYRDAPDTFSATANKALGTAGLKPTPAHTVYSLRHTFKDRLIKLEAPERVQDALMGHRVREIEYGAGPDLEQLRDWLSRVWG
ncbi:MAG: DUF6538 domain-containing protein [Hyphomicrobiaceae bacterium]